MFSSQQRKTRILFGLADLVLTAVAFETAYFIRQWLPFQTNLAIPMLPLVLVFCVTTWVAAGHWLGVHVQLQTSSIRSILRNSVFQAAAGSMGLILFEFVLRLSLSRFFLGVFALCSWALLLGFRLIVVRVARGRRKFVPREVLIIGINTPARRLAEELKTAPEIRIGGFLDPASSGLAEMRLDRVYPVYPVRALSQLLGQQVIDEVFFAVDTSELRDLEDEFLLCDLEGVRTRVPVDFFPHLNSKVSLETLGQTHYLTFSGAPDTDLRLMIKRGLDIVLATLGIIVTAPVMLAVAIAIKLTSPGPAIFRQERCGLNGRKFSFYKFRSMCIDAEARYHEVVHLSQRSLATKIPNDPRLTRIGRTLRKFSLDELPQFFNVLRGDMSLVGPRPAVPREVAQYQRWQRRRLRMRPGLTCLWVISGRDSVDFETWMKLDLEYIDNWSLGLDWKIILNTIPNVIAGKGAN
ncbi:MAG TPA: sugar transferase [Solibacterales bacterium]|nr:sugar transferase [Bryobacterales bacterium]